MNFYAVKTASPCYVEISASLKPKHALKVYFLPWELHKTTRSHLCTVLSLVAICTRSEMEDFLREAACMKEFDHANVMRLLGELLAGFFAQETVEVNTFQIKTIKQECVR